MNIDLLNERYMSMMDDMLENFENNSLEFSSIEEVNKRNSISNF